LQILPRASNALNRIFARISNMMNMAPVDAALREDIGRGDVTTEVFVPAGRPYRAVALAKEEGVLCGVEAAAYAFRRLDGRAVVRVLKKDGSLLKPGDRIMEVRGGRALLTAERTALNFMQRLSGAATMARRFVLLAKGTHAKIFDTRKTTPGLREMEKYAVLCGGACNHRIGLYDAVLIKDNHIKAAGWDFIRSRVPSLRARKGLKFVEIEAASFQDVKEATSCGPDIILLDNMPVPLLRKSIAYIKSLPGRRPEIEISGGVNLKTVRRLALLGPDRISVGQITHSAKALDISLEVE